MAGCTFAKASRYDWVIFIFRFSVFTQANSATSFRLFLLFFNQTGVESGRVKISDAIVFAYLSSVSGESVFFFNDFKATLQHELICWSFIYRIYISILVIQDRVLWKLHWHVWLYSAVLINLGALMGHPHTILRTSASSTDRTRSWLLLRALKRSHRLLHMKDIAHIAHWFPVISSHSTCHLNLSSWNLLPSRVHSVNWLIL